MSKRFLLTLLTFLVVLVGAGIAIFFTKGYTLSPTDGTIQGTGIITVSSKPDGASVYIDGHLTTATDTTISSLNPKKYHMRIAKDGFIPWEKEIEVKAGLVSEVKATLFPAFPTIYPLTYNGASNPILSPDGSQLAFAVPFIDDQHTRQKGGIWVWSMNDAPIAFTRGAQPHQIVLSTANLDFSKAKLRFSPDSQQVLITLQEGGKEGSQFERNYLISVNGTTQLSDLRDITPTLDSTLRGWEEDIKAKNQARILAIKDPRVQKIASESATVRWSPDETKFLAGPADVVGSPSDSIRPSPTTTNVKGVTPSAAKPATVSASPTQAQVLKGYKVYDLEMNKEYDLPEAISYMWLPESEHIILVQEGKISVVEYDGTNVAVLYAGNFVAGTVFPWPNSSRLVFVSSYNTPTALTPNLYGINLK